PAGSLSSLPLALSSSTVVAAAQDEPDRIDPRTKESPAGSASVAETPVAVALPELPISTQYERSAPGIATGLVPPLSGSLMSELVLVTEISAGGWHSVRS